MNCTWEIHGTRGDRLRCTRCGRLAFQTDAGPVRYHCLAGDDTPGMQAPGPAPSLPDFGWCIHLGSETGRSVQCGRCPGSRTAVYTCDLLAEYCLPLAKRPSKQTAGYVVCRGCASFEADGRDGRDGR